MLAFLTWRLSSVSYEQEFCSSMHSVDVWMPAESSVDVYQGKWAVFFSWFSQQGISPVRASFQQVADFLAFRPLEKLLSILAIKDYRAALGQVLRMKGMALSSSGDIFMLLRSFRQSCPPRGPRSLNGT